VVNDLQTFVVFQGHLAGWGLLQILLSAHICLPSGNKMEHEILQVIPARWIRIMKVDEDGLPKVEAVAK